ncbi:hypothetical protein QJS10_CPA09g01086 [Acorus calamus]|uniref:Uncharacterized protein n=1 Tax=Acorus calamus TaxID=4465 RepID=A0AAV9E4Q2_ACOCL|nr:hypothetical protein QJS10_CPA09g01086 [Acorus calamus]
MTPSMGGAAKLNAKNHKPPPKPKSTISETKPDEPSWELKTIFLVFLAFITLAVISIFRKDKTFVSIIAINLAIALLSSIPDKPHWRATLTLSSAGCVGLLETGNPAKHAPVLACAVANVFVSNMGLALCAKSPASPWGLRFFKGLRWVAFVIANASTVALVLTGG